MMISLEELTVGITSFMTIVSGRLGVDWGKDGSVKSEEGYLHPTAGEPFVDMKLTLKAQPKESVVSIA